MPSGSPDTPVTVTVPGRAVTDPSASCDNASTAASTRGVQLSGSVSSSLVPSRTDRPPKRAAATLATAVRARSSPSRPRMDSAPSAASVAVNSAGSGAVSGCSGSGRAADRE